MRAINVVLHILGDEQDTVPDGPRGIDLRQYGVNSVVGGDLASSFQVLVCFYSDGVPVLDVGAKIVRRRSLDPLDLSKSQLDA